LRGDGHDLARPMLNPRSDSSKNENDRGCPIFFYSFIYATS
jgi:hypothetical protein